MKMSPIGLELVKAFEGCFKPVPGRPGYFKAYVDPVGVLTIGWGHTNHHPPKFNANTVWSQQQCDDAKASDMAVFERHVSEHARVKLEQHEFDALTSWAFNTGGPASAGLWRELNAGRRQNVPAELAKWNKGTVNGRKVALAGLTRRRKAEGLLFAGRIDEALKVAGAKRPPTRPEDVRFPDPDFPTPPKAPNIFVAILQFIASRFRSKK
jgi:lysozyme